MTAIHPETQIVACSFDEQARVCYYTYQHSDGSRYTVPIPLDDLEKHKGNRANRRNHLATRIISHIQTNPPDAADAPPDE